MKRRFLSGLAGLVMLMLVAAACSGSTASAVSEDGVSVSCQESAQEVVDRFDTFLEPYSDLSPEEFLSSPELEGLGDFQEDVADIIVRVATDPNDECTERELEDQVAVALQDYSGEGLLNQYLVGTVQNGLTVEKRDVVVTPDDDLLTILPLLGPGSSVTFSEGTFELDGTLLVQTELILVGAGREETTLVSTAEAAAIAVLAEGDLVVNDMTVRHGGDLPASVLITFDSSITLSGVGISGAIADEEGGGGSGIVLSGVAPADGASSGPSADASVAIAESVITNNASAGIAVTAEYSPVIISNEIASNGQCGICYFDASAGAVQLTTFEANGVGVQVSGSANPEIASNLFRANTIAGMLVEVDATPVVAGNDFRGVDVVGIDVQGAAAPDLVRNTFGPHAVAISTRGDSAATVGENVVNGGEVAILVGGSALPVVTANELSDTTVSAVLHAEASAGTFTGNVIKPLEGAGVVVEGSSSPNYVNTMVEGGLVGFVFRETSGGSVRQSAFTGQDVGIEAGDDSAPVIENNTFTAQTQAAVILSGAGTPILGSNTFTDPVAIGIQAGGDGTPSIRDNTVVGGDTAILITENSAAVVENNMLSDHNFGIGVSGSASPMISGNTLMNSVGGALSFEDEASGEISNNTIVDAGVVGIRIAGAAMPTIEDNKLFALVPAPSADAEDDVDPEDAATDDAESEPTEEETGPEDAATDDATIEGEAGNSEVDESQSGAGLLFADTAAGRAATNEIFGFVIGIQVSDASTPTLIDNRVDGAGVGGVGILYGLQGAGIAEGNLSVNQQLGFQFSGTTSPDIIDSTVESVGAASFLIQGESSAMLSGNTCDSALPGIVLLEAAAPELGDNTCTLAQQ